MASEDQTDWTAEPEEAPPVSEEKTDAASEDAETVTLSVVGPLNTTEFRIPADDPAEGETLVIDQFGTAVPADDADDLIALAALYGVALARKAN